MILQEVVSLPHSLSQKKGGRGGGGGEIKSCDGDSIKPLGTGFTRYITWFVSSAVTEGSPSL